ncbi:MAG: hypothetical protein GYB67_09510 [Chloroflexi bacterium]|nr:hypothetical protein [Chloroflexota bacterium]
MGLQEKRLIQQHQQQTIPQREAQIRQDIGIELTYALDWDSFANDKAALETLDYFVLNNLYKALLLVCSDALGKETLGSTIKQIVIQNIDDIYKKAVVLSADQLVYRVAPGLGASGYFDETQLRDLIEAAL